MKFKISISYDGSKIHGWEGVGKFNYIKDLLQNSIFSFTHEKVDIICASRTDRGVHAISNVCSFILEKNWPEYKILHAMNYFLPDDIRVYDVHQVADSFDARFSARFRHYKYFLSCGTKKPILRNQVFFSGLKSFQKAQEFVLKLKGKHDFSSFCPSKTIANKVRTIEEINIEEYFLGAKIYIVNIIAKSFLHHQVRNMVGALVDFEKGYISLEEITESLCTGKKILINMAPALGLYLYDVLY
jgi:tRNA pseudouridine(38-40) synthase